MRVGPHQIEVELIGVNFGKEVSQASEIFEIEELIFLDAVHGFHIALVGVGGGMLVGSSNRRGYLTACDGPATFGLLPWSGEKPAGDDGAS